MAKFGDGGEIVKCSFLRQGPTSTASPASSTTTTTQAAPTLNVKAMLLTLDEMPTGWTAQSTGGSGASGVTGCSDKKLPGFAKAAQASFGDPSGLPTWDEALVASPNAESEVTSGLSELSACHSLTIPASSGQPAVTLAAAPVSFPMIGDQSGAFAFSGTLEGLNFVVYVVLARFGTVVAGFDYGNLGSDVSGFQALVSKASTKIKAALRTSP